MVSLVERVLFTHEYEQILGTLRRIGKFFVEFFHTLAHLHVMTGRDPFSQSGLFERAVRRILRPLVRALIAQGVTAPALYRIVKQTYVEVAAEDLGAEATDSRINVMTGVHRRDVKDFRARDASENTETQRKVSILLTVVGRWMSDPAYMDAGAPQALPRFATDGTSFEALVQSISRDIRPRTVLDELTRQGIAVLEDDHVRLLLEGLVGSADTDQKLHLFAQNLGDHMQAAVDNLLSADPQFLERAVFYNHLDPTSVDDIEAETRRIGQDALRAINTRAAQHQARDHDTPAATQRFRFGVFFYREDDGPGAKGRSEDEDR
ncbi:hypothetical protein So717_33460 [Roseobacter cerasinus]|uniref:Uncharacterized protein n=1 Tax=Roseobacter cerasinus TaxID=2602289 RepID=A0A640VTQ6_9RHOB|nr:hypothetical protein So717_33460 [Roseobacter cerasinus]